jgi:hypothetical protein
MILQPFHHLVPMSLSTLVAAIHLAMRCGQALTSPLRHALPAAMADIFGSRAEP